MLGDQGRTTALLWLVTAALAVGCEREVSPPASPPASGSATATATAPTTATASATASATATTSATASASVTASVSATASAMPQVAEAERPFTLVELAPTMGDLLPLLREHAARAKAKKLRPFVEFYADWCPPCRELNAGMSDPRMIDAFRSTYIIKINFDDWQDKLGGTGFVPRKIPMFYAIGADGRTTGKQLVADLGVKNTPEHIAPLLKAFLQG